MISVTTFSWIQGGRVKKVSATGRGMEVLPYFYVSVPLCFLNVLQRVMLLEVRRLVIWRKKGQIFGCITRRLVLQKGNFLGKVSKRSIEMGSLPIYVLEVRCLYDYLVNSIYGVFCFQKLLFGLFVLNRNFS